MFKKTKKITLDEITSDKVKTIRKAFDIPDRVSDQEIIFTLINVLIKKYFSPEHWAEKDIKQFFDF